MAQKTILIIEDDESIRDLIKYLLTEDGYNVKVGSSVTDLYEIEKDPPALVLLDNWLDGKTGHDICYQLKTAPKTSGIRVALVSATPNLERTAESCMADGYLAKPFQNEDLLVLVKKMTA